MKKIPNSLNVKSSDVKKCWFEKSDKAKMFNGEPYTLVKHKDNIY